MWRLLVFVVAATLFVASSNAANLYPYKGNGETKEYWMASGREELRKARQKPNIGVAKNVILYLGDGMGVSTVTAARILKGQLEGHLGEESELSFESFPHVGLAKTYNQDATTPDSAATATCFLSGVKTNFAILGLDARSRRNDCASAEGTELETMLEWAHAAGKSVGVVTNTRVTHATPAALYAKSPGRDWESDTDMARLNVTGGQCKDIAAQLIDNNADIRVVLGGGRSKFLRSTDVDPGTGTVTSDGRSDGRNLIEEWARYQQDRNRTHQYVWNSRQLSSVNPSETDYLLGLFAPSHMQYELDRAEDVGGEPSLAEMTDMAIKILSRNPKGYFLYVEGGRIDQAHHSAWSARALHETLSFADAVEKGVQLTSAKDTLILVTADHSHVFTIGGYPSRGNNILGLVDDMKGGVSLAYDGRPYTTLHYANGNVESAVSKLNDTVVSRPNLTNVDTTDKEYQFQSTVPLNDETHGGEDVAIYARGPMSHLIHGVHEQSYIAHVMAYASCVGSYSEASSCAMADVQEVKEATSGGDVQFQQRVILMMILSCLIVNTFGTKF